MIRPSSGRLLLFFVPTSDSLVSISELEGLFELTWRPSRAVDSPCALHLELRIHNDTIRCDGLGAKVPGKRQEQLTQTLNVHLLKKPKIEGPLSPALRPLNIFLSYKTPLSMLIRLFSRFFLSPELVFHNRQQQEATMRYLCYK